MANNLQIEKVTEEIRDVVTNQTGKCSTIGRQLMLGLTATTWAIFFIDKKFDFNYLLIIALISEVLYFLFDFMQYFFIALSYRSLFSKTAKIIKKRNETVTDNILSYSLSQKKDKVHDVAFIFFFVKFPFIVISFVFILIYIISKI
jgi:hypothetical protein